MKRRSNKERTKERKAQFIFGRHPLLEALKAGRGFEKIFLLKGMRGEYTKTVMELAKQEGIPVVYVPIEKLNRLTRKNHQGVVGIASLIQYYQLEDVLAHVYDRGEVPLFLLCDGVTDVRNFGAICRSALCAGAHGVVITAKGSASVNSDAIKTSAGAIEQIPICKVRFLDKAINYLKYNGLQIVASTIETDQLVDKIDWTIPTAVLIGAEGEGIRPKHLELADTAVRIPIAGDFDSYNVSVATGILLYESLKQRLNS